MKREIKAELFDIATATEGVSGRIADICSLFSITLTELAGTRPDEKKLEVLSNVIIDMLGYQSRDIQELAERIYDVYYDRYNSGEREGTEP